ncbi:hypothetical protein L873DRAFT_1714083, partial [Choiromyces venosus 120613-1]
DDPKCDAILVTKSKTGNEEEMKDEARDALGQALQEEELEVDHVMGEPFISNRCGLYFAAYPECLHVLEERDSAHEEIESTLKSEVTLLQGQVSTLKLSIPEYSRVRNRLISTFKRDKLNNAMESDIDIIQEGNIMAHEGDAAVDALLYEGLNGRHDPSAFEELYGIHPADVVKISE